MTVWSEFRHYACRHCRETCINHARDPWTREQECRQCHRVPDLASAQTTVSEGAGGAVHRFASAPERSEGAPAPTGRKRGPFHGSPTRKPERTPPNPEGEGVSRRQPAATQ